MTRFVWGLLPVAAMVAYWKWVPEDWEGHRYLAGFCVCLVVAVVTSALEQATRP